VLKTTRLGEWLGRMLQLEPNAFASAEEAAAAFDTIAQDPSLEAAEADGALLAFPSEAPSVPAAVTPASRTVTPAPPIVTSAQTLAPSAPLPAPTAPPIVPPAPPVEEVPFKPLAPPVVVPIDRGPKLHAVPPPAAAKAPVAPVVAKAPVVEPVKPAEPWSPGRAVAWIVGGLLAMAAVEAVAIIVLLLQPRIIIPARPLAATEQSALPSLTVIDGSANSGQAARTQPAPAPVAAPRPAGAFAAQFGRVNIVAPIDLDVFRDNAVIGSTAAPVSLPAGRHTLVLGNRSLGYRITQVVTVTNGQLTPLRITIPNVLISVNAQPWADVTVDGVARGQTPLANLSLPIGSHEFVFRHPELGERRQTVIVRADTPTRVTQDFRN